MNVSIRARRAYGAFGASPGNAIPSCRTQSGAGRLYLARVPVTSGKAEPVTALVFTNLPCKLAVASSRASTAGNGSYSGPKPTKGTVFAADALSYIGPKTTSLALGASAESRSDPILAGDAVCTG